MYRYSHSIGLYALMGRGFNNPVDVAFGSSDVMYVVNRVGPEVGVRMPYKRITICNRNQDLQESCRILRDPRVTTPFIISPVRGSVTEPPVLHPLVDL